MNLAHRIPGAVLLAAALVFCSWPASAAPVSAAWTTSDNATATGLPGSENATLRSRSEAMATCFQKAVASEALGILPTALAPGRAALLAAWLAPRAGQYVQSYSDVSTAPQGGFTVLTLDVRVDRPALRRVLQNLGVYYTAAAPRPFSLLLEGEASAHAEDLARLEALSGLYPAVVDAPQLSLNATGKVWTGRLVSAGAVASSAGALDEVWLDLWGAHFSRPEAQAGVLDSLVLRVQGWFTPDGVRDFDQELRSFEGVESAVLDRVLLTPTGTAAVWRVRTPNPSSLRTRMEAYIPGRGLTYTLDAPGQAASGELPAPAGQ